MIYDKIKQICKEKGISVASVEREAKIANGTISKWNTCSPTVDNLCAVAKVIGVPVGMLLDEKAG